MSNLTGHLATTPNPVPISKPAAEVSTLIAQHEPNKTLPQAFYTADEVFKADLKHIFYKTWLFAGHSCEVAESGDYLLIDIGDESIIIIRDKKDVLHAHFNVCRHRGSRLLSEPCGHTKTLVCPYHQWAYTLSGELSGARLMGDAFRKDAYSLRAAHIREVAGLLFVCLADTPPDFDAAFAAFAPQLRLHRLSRAKVVSRHSYEVEANWKTVVENNRECYHCQVTHPEFCLSNYDLGLPGDTRQDTDFELELRDARARWEAWGLEPNEVNFPGGSWFRVSRYPLKAGFVTESMDGKLTAPLMGDLPGPEVGSLRLIGLPNFWGHANADYASTTRLVPLSPSRTRIDISFLVRDDAAEEEFDLGRVEAVLKATAEEDWELCEKNYAGIKSLAYEPGPLSPITEASLAGFLEWYLRQLAAGEGGATINL